MSETRSGGHHPGVPPVRRPVAAEDLEQLCAGLAEIGLKLDRLEDALHDLAQVLARAVGPPWDITGD